MAQQNKTVSQRSSAKPSAASGKRSAAKKTADTGFTAEKRRRLSLILFFYGVLTVFITFIKGAGFWTTLHNFTFGMFGKTFFTESFLFIFVIILSILVL